MTWQIPAFLFTVSAASLAVLAILIRSLAWKLNAWKCGFSAGSKLADLPAKGAYGVYIEREHYWLHGGRGPEAGGKKLAHALPSAGFRVLRTDSGDEIPYSPRCRLIPGREKPGKKGGIKVTVLVGRFEAPAPGGYLLTRTSSCGMLETDTVTVRRRAPMSDPRMTAAGIAVSGAAFVMGAAFGAAMLFG